MTTSIRRCPTTQTAKRTLHKITTYSMFTKNLFIPICNPNFKKNKALNHGGNLFGWVKHPHPSPLPSFPKISKNQSLLLIMFYTKKSCYYIPHHRSTKIQQKIFCFDFFWFNMLNHFFSLPNTDLYTFWYIV